MPETINITVLDPVHCQADKPKLLKPCLSMEKVYWLPPKKGEYQKQRKTHRKALYDKDGIFLTGFMRRVMDYSSTTNNIRIRWHGTENILDMPPEKTPQLLGITFRLDQQRLINAALRRQRGVLVAPTGTGKTLLALGVASCYPGAFLLFLVHTKDLLEQTYEEFRKFGFKAGRIGGGHQEFACRITIATRQSFARLIAKSPELWQHIDIVMVDECHHVSSFAGQYAQILERLIAPMRLGFTATEPYLEEAERAMEGHLGPVIGRLTTAEAQEKEILADIKIKLVKVPEDPEVRNVKKYANVYQKGVVENRIRNRTVVRMAREYVREGETVLIFVTKIEHGHELQRMAALMSLPAAFIYGNTSGELRKKARLALRKKDMKVVIATVVWKEGINIPSLGVVMNAAGGKSEIATIQSVGRGLRRTKEKSEVVLVDFFDTSHHYLIKHSGLRVCTYMEENWL